MRLFSPLCCLYLVLLFVSGSAASVECGGFSECSTCIVAEDGKTCMWLGHPNEDGKRCVPYTAPLAADPGLNRDWSPVVNGATPWAKSELRFTDDGLESVEVLHNPDNLCKAFDGQLGDINCDPKKLKNNKNGDSWYRCAPHHRRKIELRDGQFPVTTISLRERSMYLFHGTSFAPTDSKEVFKYNGVAYVGSLETASAYVNERRRDMERNPRMSALTPAKNLELLELGNTSSLKMLKSLLCGLSDEEIVELSKASGTSFNDGFVGGRLDESGKTPCNQAMFSLISAVDSVPTQFGMCFEMGWVMKEGGLWPDERNPEVTLPFWNRRCSERSEIDFFKFLCKVFEKYELPLDGYAGPQFSSMRLRDGQLTVLRTGLRSEIMVCKAHDSLHTLQLSLRSK